MDLLGEKEPSLSLTLSLSLSLSLSHTYTYTHISPTAQSISKDGIKKLLIIKIA